MTDPFKTRLGQARQVWNFFGEIGAHHGNGVALKCLDDFARKMSDERFEGLPGFPYAPQYAEVADGDGGTTRMPYLDGGPAEGPVVGFRGRDGGGGDPTRGLPEGRQIPGRPRVLPRVKFAFEAVKHDFVGKQAVTRDELEMTVTPEGWLRIDRLRYVEPRRPQTCEGGITRASERLRVSQPAISAQLRELERNLSVTKKAHGDHLTFTSNFTREQFEQPARPAKEHIAAGDIYQVGRAQPCLIHI